MSNYIKLETGEVKTQGEWRSANKHISLPRVWTAGTLEFLGLTAVLAAPKPDCTDLQQVMGNGVTTDANGKRLSTQQRKTLTPLHPCVHSATTNLKQLIGRLCLMLL